MVKRPKWYTNVRCGWCGGKYPVARVREGLCKACKKKHERKQLLDKESKQFLKKFRRFG